MLDGLYQSVICFYMTYCLFEAATAVTESGLNIDDQRRMGVFIASAAVVVVNSYIMINTYRWDWLILLVSAISILLTYFWTGVYTTSTGDFQFYGAAKQSYGQANFWAIQALTIVICLMPRFMIKTFQKVYFPRDIDIVREQVLQGQFDYLNDSEPSTTVPQPGKVSSLSSSDDSKPSKSVGVVPDEERPIYPPSVAPTNGTHNPRSQNGSDGTDYTGHDSHLGERPARLSVDRPRPSFDRVRQSMDRARPSFESSNDFTSAAYLSRIESSESARQFGRRKNDTCSPLRDTS